MIVSTRAFLVSVACLFSGTAVAAAAIAERLPYPNSPSGSISDSYFGTIVKDPYRWLEDGNDPAVKAWALAQTSLAQKYIGGTSGFAGYRERIATLSRTSTRRFRLVVRGERLVYERQTPPQQQPQLIARDGLTGAERVLFDPEQSAGSGPAPAIESVAVAPDGSKVAFTTQLGGSENETVHVVDATTGRLLPDTLEHAGGGESPVALAWDGDGRGLLHTLWPKNADGTYATSGILIYHHILGTDPASDTYVFGKGLSPRSEYSLASSLDGAVQAAVVADGDGVHASVYLRKRDGAFALVATPDAGIGDSDSVGGAFVGDTFYAVATQHDSRGEIVALVPGGTFDTAKVVVPASSPSSKAWCPSAAAS